MKHRIRSQSLLPSSYLISPSLIGATQVISFPIPSGALSSTWSLALFACLSSLESDAGRALLAGNNAYDHRGVLPAFSLFFLDN